MFFAMLLALAPAEANLATCAPREPPATGRCCYGFPAPSALQGCFLNLPTEAFDEAFSSSGLLTTEPCATVTTMPCPTPRPAVKHACCVDVIRGLQDCVEIGTVVPRPSPCQCMPACVSCRVPGWRTAVDSGPASCPGNMVRTESPLGPHLVPAPIRPNGTEAQLVIC